jgi:hypothetical protein
MGNKSSLSGGESNSFEYNSAKRLLLSIKLNSKEQTEEAIELARKECVKPSRVFASVFSYDDMVQKILEYLTKVYSIEGQENEMPKRMTPLEYANSIDALNCAQVISDTIVDLEKSISAKEKQNNNIVSQTKETLKSRQSDYQYTRKGVKPLPSKVVVGKAELSSTSTKHMINISNNNNPDRVLEAKMKLKAFQETKVKK